MLTENRDATAKKGCLMAMISKEDTDKILKFNKQLINDSDLYIENGEYGRETECHVTIRYGFINDLNELQVRQLLKGQKPFMVELIGLDKFVSSPQYDVAMFKVSSPVLKKLNEMSGIYLNENDYPDYNPHLTLAYVQKGKFPHTKEGLRLRVPIKTICYSPIQGGKSYFNLEENNVSPAPLTEDRKHLVYIGNCKTGLEDTTFQKYVASDATEMEHLVGDDIPNSKKEKIRSRGFFLRYCDVPDFLRQKMSQHNFEFARNVSPYTHQMIFWAYDLDDDVHYFFV
jgi:hypothetical protein